MTTTLLATGSQLASGTGAAVDVSALAIFRADIDLGATDLPGGGEVAVTFQHAPTAAGPWATLSLVRVATGNPPGSSDYYWPSGKRRVLLSGFDAFMRVTWAAKSTWGTPSLTLGVSG